MYDDLYLAVANKSMGIGLTSFPMATHEIKEIFA